MIDSVPDSTSRETLKPDAGAPGPQLDYAKQPELIFVRRHWRGLLITAAIFFALIMVPTPQVTESSYVDAVTGSMRSTRIGPFGWTSGAMTQPSPLEKRLKTAGIAYVADWRLPGGRRHTPPPQRPPTRGGGRGGRGGGGDGGGGEGSQ